MSSAPGCQKWYHVWAGPSIDRVFEKRIDAKKHAAWLDWVFGYTACWGKAVKITGPMHEEIPFDDFEFRNGESRRIRNSTQR